MTASPDDTPQSNIEFPDKPSLFWLLQHMPLQWIVLFVTMFVGIGFSASQFLPAKASHLSDAQIASLQAYESKFDRLSDSYQGNMKELQAALIKQEDAAANTYYSSDRERYISSADRIRSDIEKAHLEFQKSLDAFSKAVCK